MYKAIICELRHVRPHSNADKIQLATVYSNQIIISLNNEQGQLGIFFPTDGQLSEEFCEANDLIGYTDENGERKGGYFDHKRRVRAQNFRGEKSEGFWMPISCLEFTKYNLSKLKDGDQLDELNGIKICEKYITKASRQQGSGNKKGDKRFKKTKEFYPTFKEHSDTEQLDYNIRRIPAGSLITITDKLHGTSARSSYAKVLNKDSFWRRFVNRFIPIYKSYEWKYVYGSRRVIFDKDERKGTRDYYKTTDFREDHHNKFVNQLKKGETIYYEIVGWASNDKLIMGSVDCTKVKDKAFVKKYGKTMAFTYGCPQGTSNIYIYRISSTNEDGETIDYSWQAVKTRCAELGVQHVPESIDQFIYDGDQDNLMELVENLIDKEDTVDPTQVLEGVVVRYENGIYFNALKKKNYHFKVLEGIIKEDDTIIDIEESQG